VRQVFSVSRSQRYSTGWTLLQRGCTDRRCNKSAGHATVFRVGEEKDLAARLKDLAGRRFGCTASQIRRAAFPFANNRSISHLWDEQNMCAGKACSAGLLKVNGISH
jgi:hypothetical protein